MAYNRPMARARSWLTGGLGIVVVIAVAKLLLHLATASRYGYFGDELYFMACGEHLDWGYVDQPPLVALVAWIVRHTLGTSLLAMRLPSALAGAALVLLTGLLARELGGGRFAMGLSALASGLAFVYIVMHYLFTMNAFEPLFWTGCAYLVVRIVKTGDQRLWLGFGLLAGLGLQNKYSMAVFAFALVVGVLLDPERRAFARPWIWLGGALAFLVFLPNVIWNVQHGWPFFELMRNIRASGRDVALGPVEYVARQVLNMNPANLPVWLAGLGWLLFSGRGRPFRPLGWAFLVTLATFVVTKGKDYYLAPAFATLFAAGAVGIEGFTDDRPAPVAAAGPRRAAGPDAGLPAPRPADPGRGPADRVAGAPGLHAAHDRESPRARGPAAPLRLAVRLGRDGRGGRRRVPRDAAGGAGAGGRHREQLRRLRRRSTCSGRSTACR